mmetsp:Transcript_29787/g.50045  ORF Transcript_29787/g.50045 Transcript_29787/m.50045 type:complete len:243 (+) Transcript_29787:2993-3721(+)
MLQKRSQQAETVALFHFRHKGLHREEAPHRKDQVLDEFLLALRIQKGAHHQRGVGRIHLLAVPLDVAHHVVGVQVAGQVVDESEPVAHVDQRASVRQLRFHQELLDPLRVVLVRFPGDTLDFLDLARLGSRLDVLGVHLRVLAGCDVRAEVEIEPLVALEGLEQLHDGGASQLLGVLLGDLHHQLQVLPDVAGQKLLEAVDGPLPREGAEELYQCLRLDAMSVHDHALDVRQIGVVAESACI